MIVAGGGGGGSYRYTTITTTSSGEEWVQEAYRSGNVTTTLNSGGTYQTVETFNTVAGELYRVYANSSAQKVHIYLSGGGEAGIGEEFTAKGTWASANFIHNAPTAPSYTCSIEHYKDVSDTSTSTNSSYSNQSQQGGGTSGKG